MIVGERNVQMKVAGTARAQKQRAGTAGGAGSDRGQRPAVLGRAPPDLACQPFPLPSLHPPKPVGFVVKWAQNQALEARDTGAK